MSVGIPRTTNVGGRGSYVRDLPSRGISDNRCSSRGGPCTCGSRLHTLAKGGPSYKRSQKTERNAPCRCGSGAKQKKCCGG